MTNSTDLLVELFEDQARQTGSITIKAEPFMVAPIVHALRESFIAEVAERIPSRLNRNKENTTK